MTELLYMDDSYLREFTASVRAADGNLIELDRTAFYPAGGGEPSDTGKIVSSGHEFTVTNVSRRGGAVLHEVDRPGLVAGQEVRGVLDWERRYRIMRMHTAAHLLSAVFYKEAGALITGNQLDVDKSRIDFSLEAFDRERILEYARKANQLIREDIPVKIYSLPRDEALKISEVVKLAGALPPNVDVLRIVEIVGVDVQADGGNHVRSLKEIGEIQVLKLENKGKSNRRLYYSLK